MRIRIALGLVALCWLLGACAPLNALYCAPQCANRVHNTSSLVGFLYPNGAAPPPENTLPELPVPLRVGLAFLPSQSVYLAGGPTAARQQELLERIRARFASRKFVGEITIIPDYYLSGGTGFEGLEGVQRLYDVDVMALVSFDQVTMSSEMKFRSLAYLTIVGAFIVEGSEHDVSTLVDLAVVDPKTHSLILRAGGTDNRRGTSTMLDKPRETRYTANESFSHATDAMIDHFDAALVKYEADVRAGNAQVRVVNKDGSPRGGGGAFDLFAALLLLPVALLRLVRRSRSGRAGGARLQ